MNATVTCDDCSAPVTTDADLRFVVIVLCSACNGGQQVPMAPADPADGCSYCDRADHLIADCPIRWEDGVEARQHAEVERAMTQSPFVRRALAGQLPASEVGIGMPL
jgi:hypothetical protein